jgi:hypothetical protein
MRRRRVSGGRLSADGAGRLSSAISRGRYTGQRLYPARQFSRSPRWARVLIAVGVLLALLSAGALTGGLLLADYAGSVSQAHLLGGAATHSTTDGGTGGDARITRHRRIDGPVNILLVGIDERPDDPTGGARSDTIIIAHIPAAHDRVYLMSVPRDSRVDIPATPRPGIPAAPTRSTPRSRSGTTTTAAPSAGSNCSPGRCGN